MDCLIIEDEKIAAKRLKDVILKCDSTFQIVEILQSVSKSVDFLCSEKAKSLELIFMDIQLSDGLSFEIFEQTEVNAPIIFTTAYDEYALKAFKVNSIDYLLKPIDEEELCKALHKFKGTQKPKSYPSHIFDSVLKGLTNDYKKKFIIKVGEHIKIIPTEEVQCFYSMEKYTFLQNLNGRDFAVNNSLDQLVDLVDPKKFFRINRQYLIAFSAIKDIISFSNSRLLIKLNSETKEELIVSRERVQDFREWLES